MEQLQWVLDNWGAIVAALSILVSLASAITRLTPTKHDDEVVAAVQEALGRVSLLHPPGSPTSIKPPGARPTWGEDVDLDEEG